MRLPDHCCAITVSGADKGRLAEDDITIVDLDGSERLGKKPSAETTLHLQLYRWNADIHTVLHVHSVNATVVSRVLADRDHLVLTGYELLKAFVDVRSHEAEVIVPIFDNTQDISSLAERVASYLHSHPSCVGYLIRGHGVYTWGTTMDECTRHLEALDFLLDCVLLEYRYRQPRYMGKTDER